MLPIQVQTVSIDILGYKAFEVFTDLEFPDIWCVPLWCGESSWSHQMGTKEQPIAFSSWSSVSVGKNYYHTDTEGWL